VRIALFCHSLLSDWNHGNAHFLRGVVTELLARGHDVASFEPRDAWSLQNLLRDAGEPALTAFQNAYPAAANTVRRYDPETLDLDEALDRADLVVVHEWNAPELVRRIGNHRIRGGRYALLFHDTHHRAVTAPAEMARYDLSGFDGVLAFGGVIRDLYLRRRWAARAWTWHEAADVRVFRPRPGALDGDLVWIGNWGDEERTSELQEFLLEPVSTLALTARVHGVRYPAHARASLERAGIRYAGWLANHDAPAVFGRFRVTVHVPRGPYSRALPGIPTIRPFEALACGIPLVSAPWSDDDGLFRQGFDYLMAHDGRAMRETLRDVLHDARLATSLAEEGRRTILARHTCAHRVDELLAIHRELTLPISAGAAGATPPTGASAT
jgi:spore maturation protein CgeB